MLLVQMAPDYDHLCLMQKVEVFEHALEHTQGDDLAKILWYKSPGSEVSRLSAAVLSVEWSCCCNLISGPAAVLSVVLLLQSYQWSCCSLISGPAAAVLSVVLLLLQSYQWSFCCCSLISGPVLNSEEDHPYMHFVSLFCGGL